MNEAVRVESLTFQVDNELILDNVNFSVDKNSIVGIIGPNGSGKTTMMKHFYRAIHPNVRTIFIDGKDIHNFSFCESARKLSVMRQENPTDFRFSVLNMVLLGRSPYLKFFESFTETDKKLAIEALERVGMAKQVNKDYRILSGGEKQRVLIARSIVQQADILILDEPTNHLDVHYQWALMKMISELDKTVIAVFHDLNLASKFCHKLFVVEKGKMIFGGTPEEVLTENLLSKVFGIKAKIIQEENRLYVLYKEAVGQ